MTFRCSRLIVVLTLCVASVASAKTVSVQWKPMRKANRYELRIQKAGKVVLDKKLETPKWSGDLEFGVYDYQIRAFDKIERAGEWSAPKALVVMTAAPVASADQKEKIFHTPETQSVLRWKPVAGADRYEVVLQKDGSTVMTETVAKTELPLTGLKQGNYSWQVSAVFDAGGRAPASLQNRQWKSKPSEPTEFVLKHVALAAPEQKSPLGAFKPPRDGKLHLKWAKVDGAEAYEVVLAKLAAQGRTPASSIVARSSFITKQDHLDLRISGEGSYVWEVRAIASLSEQKDPDDLGIKSVARFILDRNAIYDPGTGYLAFKTYVAPYTYQVQGPQTAGSSLSTSSAAATLGLSGEYWFERQWGVGGEIDNRYFALAGQNFSDPDMRFALKYRVALDSGDLPWALYPEAGLELRQYTYIVPSASGTGISSWQNFMTAGPVAGFDLRKQLSQKLSLGGTALCYLPLAGGNPDSNLSAGLQGLYWFASRWAAGAGVFVETRQITRSSSAGDETVKMNGSYFFGSLVWSFGR